MSSLLKTIFEKGHSTDVNLSVENELKRKIPAHRAILMSASGYFEKMFSSDFVEKNAECVTLGNSLNFETLEILIKFLYTNELEPTRRVSLEDLLCAADYLQMETAVEKINVKIVEEMSNVNVLRFWALRGMIKDTAVIGKVRQFILKNFSELIFDIAFLKLDFETISWIIESDELTTVSEMEVYRAIRIWINHDHVAREKHFLELLCCVRYSEEMPLDFIMKDMLRECKDTESMDVVIEHLAKRLNYTGDLGLVDRTRTGEVPVANPDEFDEEEEEEDE